MNGSRKRMWMDDMVDGRRLAEERSDLPTIVTGEIGPDPRSQIGGLADVQDVSTGIAEEVDAGRSGEIVGEAEFLRARMSSHRGQREQIIEAGDTETTGPLDEEMKEIARGERVVERAMRGLVGES